MFYLVKQSAVQNVQAPHPKADSHVDMQPKSCAPASTSTANIIHYFYIKTNCIKYFNFAIILFLKDTLLSESASLLMPPSVLQ